MSKKATIIAVVNQKGGTGKTTTTENLGVGLALEGKKVLLVDTDPQASLTVSLGNPCPDDLSPTLSDLMGKIMMENPITPDEGILHHPEGVDLVPSNIELSGMEVALVNAMSRETILRQYLDTVKQNYDYILLDCMPSLGMLTVNALAAADNVLIPVQAAYVINHCGNGWSVGRLTANGLMGVCDIIPKSSAKPGDLIFFQGTYDTSGASHVGIYVGNGMMIHCGNPISYASIESNYWQQHFYCFGRIRN